MQKLRRESFQYHQLNGKLLFETPKWPGQRQTRTGNVAMEAAFTAIDFETAHGKRWSICQVGLVRVEKGLITDKLSLLVCPPDNYYFWKNTEIHGITPDHTRGSHAFPLVWKQIKSLIHDQTVVAHNGAFDFSCLQQTLDFYGIRQPSFHQQCTYRIYGKSLAVMCQEYGIGLKHHDALSDAMACAELYQIHLNEHYTSLKWKHRQPSNKC